MQTTQSTTIRSMHMRPMTHHCSHSPPHSLICISFIGTDDASVLLDNQCYVIATAKHVSN